MNRDKTGKKTKYFFSVPIPGEMEIDYKLSLFDHLDYKKMQDDLFIEMLDVFFNSILYVRDVYPSAIFRPRRVYSTGVYVSILPPLNDYLKKVLQTAQELHVEKNLRSVELVIYREGFEMFDDYFEERVLEKFVFQVEPNEDYKTLRRTNVGSYLLKFEEQVRQALFQLNHICKNMQPLEYEHNFRIQLETTELAFTQLVSRDNSKSKEEVGFPILSSLKFFFFFV